MNSVIENSLKLVKSVADLDAHHDRFIYNAWPSLEWGLYSYADDGWFYFKLRRDVMAADILYVEYWGA
jgi:hypothetical protein